MSIWQWRQKSHGFDCIHLKKVLCTTTKIYLAFTFLYLKLLQNCMTLKMLQNSLKTLYFRLKYKFLFESKNNVKNLDRGGNTNLGSDLPQPQDRIASQLKPLIKILHYVGGYPIVKKSVKQNLDCKPSSSSTQGAGYTENKIDTANRSPGKQFYLSDKSIFEKLENIKINKIDVLETEFVNKDIGKYELTYTKWARAESWYSYIVKIITFLSTFAFLFNIALDIPFPLRMFGFIDTTKVFKSDVTKNINKATKSVSAILKLVETTVLLVNSGGFLDWINIWSVFEMDFWQCFGFGKSNTYFKFDISYFRNLVFLCYLVIPGMIWGAYASLIVLKNVYLQYAYLSGAVLMWAFFGLWVNPLLEDTKIIILFRTSCLALRQIRLAIKGRCSTPKFPLTPDDVIGWRNLITSARAQTALACNYIKSQELIFIAETIMVCSLCLGFIATVIGESGLSSKAEVPLFISTGYYCISSIIRLYVKVILAEQIPAEELLIARDITEIDAKCNDAPTKIELKFLHNMLTQQTVQVNMGNYFNMNKQLMLKVGSQVVTYLIVIMQFKGATGQ